MSLADEQPNLSFSEDDGPGEAGPSNRAQSTKRGTRACDRCRKIKSKCEPGAGERCKNCELANTRPSFKRGPPKGYIHSIEQRWHQVECILATVMESPRAQELIHDLRGDPFANAILDRVQTGPYGARSRLEQNTDTTSDSFYASLVQVPDHAPARDDRRSRRQSRVSREIVSQDPTALATPTREWQEQLSRRLTYGNQWTNASTSLSPVSRPSSSTGSSNEYARARRRLDYGPGHPGQPGHVPLMPQSWDNLYTLTDTQGGEPNTMDDTTEVFGHLSVDDNKEFRYHGSASGLPLLAQSRRKTGDGLQEHRIWKFGASHLNPEMDARDSINEEEDVEVNLPAQDTQNHLLQLYFTYVHPFFPIVHKQDFLYHYHALPCKLLLLAMFAIAARYSDRPEDHPGQPDSDVSRAGQQFAEDAHKLLDRKYQTSRPSTCQALLLLAIREFGMGAMDEGWLYSGMALRMAIDLGMNRNADSWTTDGTTPVFTDSEKQIRKHIWWSCCICDKLSAVWLGRPITFRANDYSTPVPDSDEVDEIETWQPYPPGSLGHDFVPQPARLMTTFQEACHLSVIITDVMDKIYPVQPSSETPRRLLFEQLETRLAKWIISLPEHLRYSSNDKNANPLPHILMLHIEYQAAVLLLHRALGSTNPAVHNDTLSLKAFDVCTSSAAQITSMAEIYNSRFGLDKAPPFLSIYLQSAGIMHAITLTRRPWDPQATLGLTRCISACKRMEKLWPTTTRLRLLLEGVKVRLDETAYAYEGHVSSHKRSVEDALGSSQNPDIAARDMYGLPPADQYHAPPSTSRAWDYAANARVVAQTLGTGMPGGEQSTFYPGYQWWPSQLMTTEGLTHMSLSAPMEMPPVSVYGTMAGMSMAAHAHDPHPQHHQRPPVPVSQSHAHHAQQQQQQHHHHGHHQEGFTFDQSQMSPEFGQGVQGLNYPGYQYRYPTPGNQGPSHQPHQ
ncbi:fungal-specific transcription factor domain-containing protein [Trametes maxima]|nr:fungal-specific transcription factor domain-containing protein [Trametes maxima]